jgi:putative DNA primase/helicase
MSDEGFDQRMLADTLASTLQLRWLEQEIYEYLPDTGIHDRRSSAWLQAKVLNRLSSDFEGLSVTSALVNNVCSLVKGLSFTSEGIPPPFWISSRTPANVLVLRNGILRLDLGCSGGAWKLDPFDPNLFEVAALPYAYDPKATCPLWIEKLTWTAGGDRGIVEMIRQFTATALIVPRLKLEKFLWLVGGGRNGKSTVFGALRNVLGDKSTSALGLNAFSGAHNFRLAPILHRRANFCADASVDRRADVASLNAFVSGDPIALNRKYREHVVVEPSTVLFFASNADPLVSDPSDAFWRRLLLVRCDQKLRDDEVDPTLIDDLKAEAPGILNWLLEAIPGIIKAKAIDVPEKVRRDVAELKAQVNGFRIFAAEELEAAGPESCVTRDELMAEFEMWATRNHLRKDDLVVVRQEMKRIFGSALHRRRKGDGGKRVPVWSGVRWQIDKPADTDPKDSDVVVSSKRSPGEPPPMTVRRHAAVVRGGYSGVTACHSPAETVSRGAAGSNTGDSSDGDDSTGSDSDSDDITELMRFVDSPEEADTQTTGGGR